MSGVPILDAFRLDGKVAIVTGASSGLGAAIAEAFAEAGADVALGARRLDRLEETEQRVRRAGRRSMSVVTDVSDPEACANLVQHTLDEFGSVDVLVNSAGVGTAIPALRETPEEYWAVVTVNLGGAYFMAQAAARVMAPGSSVINVASIGAFVSFGNPQAAYQSSKSGVIGLTRDLAMQWTGRKGIRVNALAPGHVRTELNEEWFRLGGFDGLEGQLTPAGRPGRPDEVAAAAVFLASDAASYVSGSTLVVDGGRTVY